MCSFDVFPAPFSSLTKTRVKREAVGLPLAILTLIEALIGDEVLILLYLYSKVHVPLIN